MKIDWTIPSNPRVEHGIDRGVVYVGTNPGVAWNGLIAVDESFEGGERETIAFDGIKYLEYVNSRFFNASIRAFNAPPEFYPCFGHHELIPGFILTRQPRVPFNMSYRSLSDGDVGYKLHLIYNARVIQQGRGYLTRGEEVEPTELSWRLDAIPEAVSGMRPTAHFILDSREADPEIIAVIESYLYGSAKTAPVMPAVEMIFDLTSNNVL